MLEMTFNGWSPAIVHPNNDMKRLECTDYER
jgi:hypothetical protein